MATTPDEWLPILANRMDARRPQIALNRSYANGDARLPEMGQNTRASWEAFQKKARTDMGGLACMSLAGRIVPIGVRVGPGKDSPGAVAARRVWRDNRLDVVFADAIWNMLSTSYGYLVTGIRAGDPIITSEIPEQFITAPDPIQPWRALAALKAWRDEDAGKDRAIVWVPGARQRYSRSSVTELGVMSGQVSGRWESDGDPELYRGGVPCHSLENFNRVAEFEPHIDVIDRINLGKLQRLVVTAMQAYKQRAMKGGLPKVDEDENEIDWAKIFEPAPGALWDLPEGIDVWESAAVDIRPLLEGEKTDMRDFAAVMQLPIDVFLPAGENQSATGAANAHKGEIQRAKDRIARASAPMEAALLDALRILGLDDGSTVEIQFAPPEHVSLMEKTAAAKSARDAGYSRRWVAQNIMGMSPDEIAENESALAEEMLQQSILVGAPSGDAGA